MATAFVALLVADCGGPTSVASDRADGRDAAPDPASTSVTVRFHDSSVPPPVQRNWEVTLDHRRMRLTVDSYGDPVAHRSVRMDPEAWATYVADLPTALQPIRGEQKTEVCPGGVSVDLEVDGAASLDRTVAAAGSCVDDDTQQVYDDILALVEPFSHDLRLQRFDRT